jgi:hypothetical protein
MEKCGVRHRTHMSNSPKFTQNISKVPTKKNTIIQSTKKTRTHMTNNNAQNREGSQRVK